MKTFATLAALAVLATPALALAAGPYGEAGAAMATTDMETIHVTDRGLDLNRPRDAAAMLRRISSAALEACGGSDFSFPEYRRAVWASPCYHNSVAAAVRQLNSPAVNELYGQADTAKLASN